MKYKIEKNTVQETLIIPLYSRKLCSELYPNIYRDETAIRLIDQIDYDFSEAEKNSRSLMQRFGSLEVAMRQNDLAWEVRDYLKTHPNAAVVNLGCGLDSTGRSCDNGSCKIYNLDFPDVITVRNELLPAGEREKNIPCDLNDTAWFSEIDASGGAVFFASGVFYYFLTEQVRALVRAMADAFPGGILVFDAANRMAVKMIAKTWLKSAKIKDVGAYFAVSDAPKEIGAWDSRLQVTSRGYMLGYNDLKDPSVSGFFRFLAKVGDGMMKISASWVVVAVLVLRFCLKKAPKWVNVLLWGLVAARMLFPFSIESALSLIPSAEPISPRIMTDPSPSVQTGVPALNQVINPVISGSFTPAPGASANPLQLWIPVFTALWLVGAAALFLYSAVSYWHLRRKVCEAVLLRDNIYQSEAVGAPFVLGIIKPKIYLPYQIDSREMGHVIAHEQTHIRRRDHWWKPLGFLLLTIHWFNPLMWLSYVLLCRDIELACDERVIKEMGNAQRADYTQALVACSVNRRSIAACPLAFGEIGVKERVKSVMNYKKPAFWIVLASVIVCAVIAVCFLTNPIGFHFDASANTIVSANHLDMRNADDPVAIKMTPAQISELSSRLAGVKHCRRSDKYAGLTAGYQISAQLQDGTYLRISGYHLSNNAMVDLEQNGKRYTVSDKDFQDYLSRVCAGEDAAPAQDHPSTAALPSTDLSTPEKIAALLDAICASPAQSSNPSDYVAAHSAEYQKLINYGAYTLLYCYKEFLKGGQTDLKGWIMALACQSIADAWGETPEPLENAVLTGQDWFDGFFSYAFVLEKNHTPEEMAKDYPCSLLLLQCAPGFYDSLIFDVDGDGIQEICILTYGRTSGLFTFTFRATELGTNMLKYDTSFWTEWYDLSFVCGEDGVVRVQGIDQKDPPQTHLFDIAAADGSILLTEDGVSISYR